MEDGCQRTWNAGLKCTCVSEGWLRLGEGSGASIAPAVVAASYSMMSKLIAATQLSVGHNVYLRAEVVAVYYAGFVAASRIVSGHL